MVGRISNPAPSGRIGNPAYIECLRRTAPLDNGHGGSQGFEAGLIGRQRTALA
jgi:hypothetical protein